MSNNPYFGGCVGLVLGVILLTLFWRVVYGCWWWS
jgi:hypothetical protein